MISDAYGRTKSAGGKLKMRALAVRAEGGEDAAFAAAVLLREAARTEDRALRVLVAPSAEERLGVAVERCALFVEALAPTAAAVAWGDVLVQGDALPAEMAEAHRSKLEPQYHELQKAHHEALATAPTLSAVAVRVPAARDPARALREIDRLLAMFPGEFELWYLRYQSALFGGDDAAAWDALEKARELEPDNVFALGAEFVLVPRVLPLAEAERRLDAAYSLLRRPGVQVEPDTCLCFAIACFSIAERSGRPQFHYERVLEAAEAGAGAEVDRGDAKRDLRVARALAKDLLAGRKPTLDAFYRAGRGDQVAHATVEERKDPIRLLTGARDRARQRYPLAA